MARTEKEGKKVRFIQLHPTTPLHYLPVPEGTEIVIM